MRTPYYREQALEGIAREVITAYDPNLYYGVPRMIPIEDIIEAQGITLEYQCLRKTGCVLGETIFDDGGAIIYDYDIPTADRRYGRRFSGIQTGHAYPLGEPSSAVKNFRILFSKKRTEKARRHGTRNTQDPSLSHLREGTDRGCSSGGGPFPISAVCHGRG